MHLQSELVEDEDDSSNSGVNCNHRMDSTDPRVQVELENLNTSTEFINKLELELEKARKEFNKLLCDSTQKIEDLAKRLSSSIDKARPYYEARITANELHQQAQQEASKFEQATEAHNKAKAVVHLAEQNLQQHQHCDTTLDALLIRSAEKVNQSELNRLAAQKQHEITSRAYSLNEQRLSKLHKELKRSIVKASLETRRNFLDLNNYANQHQLQLLPYFEMKAQFNQMLEEQVNKIRSYEARVNKAKANYTKALQRLEELNTEIYDDCSSENTRQHEQSCPSVSDNESDRPEWCCCCESEICRCKETDTASHTQSNKLSQQLNNSSTSVSEKDLNIFDTKLLDELLLEDKLESTLEQLKKHCLT